MMKWKDFPETLFKPLTEEILLNSDVYWKTFFTGSKCHFKAKGGEANKHPRNQIVAGEFCNFLYHFILFS